MSKYEIWQREDGMALFMTSPEEDEAKLLQELGMKRAAFGEFETKKEANDAFVAWCKAQQPDARVEEVSSAQLRRETVKRFVDA